MFGLIPEEGEIVSFCGGSGNRILSQRKRENGIYYKRENEIDDWIEYDANEEMENFITSIIPEIKEEILVSYTLNKKLDKRRKINSMLNDVSFINWILIAFVFVFNWFLIIMMYS